MSEDTSEKTWLNYPDAFVEGILEHHAMKSIVVPEKNDAEQHGVKGQKWGIRRKVDSSTGRVTKSDHVIGFDPKTGEVKKISGGSRSERNALKEHLNSGGTLNGKTLLQLRAEQAALVPRTDSADAIATTRTLKKINEGGLAAVSNAELRAFSQRLQVEKEASAALSTLQPQTKTKADGFIKSFIKKQSGRQFDRVANKAVDIAVEQALKQAGVKTGNPHLGEIAKRIAPKKGK